MRATPSKKKVAALCLAATLASAGAATVAQAESPTAARASAFLAELTALWDAWQPWGAGHPAEPADNGQAASSGEPEVGPYAEPGG